MRPFVLPSPRAAVHGDAAHNLDQVISVEQTTGIVDKLQPAFEGIDLYLNRYLRSDATAPAFIAGWWHPLKGWRDVIATLVPGHEGPGCQTCRKARVL